MIERADVRMGAAAMLVLAMVFAGGCAEEGAETGDAAEPPRPADTADAEVGGEPADTVDAEVGGEPADTVDAEVGGEPAEGVDRYTLRGQVVELPSDRRQMRIRHEAIPNFRNAQGEIVGMDAMVMAFPPAEDVSLEGIDSGDKVRFTFEVQWRPRTSMTLTQIEQLPADTELDYTRSDQSEAEPADSHEGQDHDGETGQE